VHMMHGCMYGMVMRVMHDVWMHEWAACGALSREHRVLMHVSTPGWWL
jgi:hypothetical protein